MSLTPEFVFSQSSLQDFVDCPRRFQLKYLEHLRYPAPEVDEVLELEAHSEQGRDLHQAIHQHNIGIPAELLLERLNEPVRTWFENYLASDFSQLQGKLYPEYSLIVPLGEYQLLAKFDLIQLAAGKALIVDWKTNRHIPKRHFLEKRLQTIVYRYVLAKASPSLNGGVALPPEQITMVYAYLQHGAQVLQFDYDAASYAEDEGYLLDLVAMIAKETVFPLTSQEERCRFCSYRGLCGRGVQAGNWSDWQTEDSESESLAEFTLDLEQIAEIEF